jgi:hypothetical protein
MRAEALRIEVVGKSILEPASANSVLAGRHIVVGQTAAAEADDDGLGLYIAIHGFPYFSREHLGAHGPNVSGEVGLAAAVQ